MCLLIETFKLKKMVRRLQKDAGLNAEERDEISRELWWCSTHGTSSFRRTIAERLTLLPQFQVLCKILSEDRTESGLYL